MNKSALVVVAVAAALTGCKATTPAGLTPRDQVNQAWTVEYGEIYQLQKVKVEGKPGEDGAVAGGLLGFSAGSNVGNGGGALIAAAVVGVAGAIAGAAIEERITRYDAFEITVDVDDEIDSVTVIQPTQNETYQLGQRVKILRRSDGAAKVARL